MTKAVTVPFFRYPSVFTDHEEDFVTIFRDVGRRGAFIRQKDLTEFEESLSTFTGAPHAIGVANATDALEMLVRVAGIGAGDEVIISSHTMLATASSIVANGAVPVPVDPGADHLIAPESVKSAITSKTKAIMPTQLNGRVCDMNAIQAIAKEHGLLILEDSAQALGARFAGTHAGTFGIGGCISFYPAKVLGCFGDGGAILCNDPDVWMQLVSMCDHGRNPVSGEFSCWGRNSRLDNLQAAFLLYQLKFYQKTIDRRRELAALYNTHLAGNDALVLPPAPSDDGAHYDVFQNYEIEAEDRDALAEYLLSKGVGTLKQWNGVAVHQLTHLGFTQNLPHTDALFTRLLMLPLNLSLTDQEVIYVCEMISEFYSK